MSQKLALKVLFDGVDKLTKPLKAISGGSNDTAKALKATRDQLKAFNDEQKRIDAFRATSKNLAIQRQELDKVQERVKGLAAEMKATTAPSRELQRAWKEATTDANNLKGAISRLQEKQQALRTELSANGADTHKLAGYQRDLKAKIAATTAEFDKQRQALDQHNKRMQALNGARHQYDRRLATRDKIAGAGIALGAAGGAVGLPVLGTVKQFASFEDAMLGVARQVDGARDANGQLTKTYYEMGDSIKAMAERIPMATTEIAAIVEAGARMGIQGQQNLLTFAETTAVTATAFDLPVDQVGEQMGKLSQLYKVPIKDIKALGDTINWLDDNALSKGGDIIDVMQRVAGTADSVKMGYKDAAALGSTFLSLGAKAEVAASASNAMMRELSIATMQSKRFQGGMDMLKLSSKDIQLGMSKDATGTILKVLDAIKALPQEKQLEAATRLFGKEFGDDAAKLAANLDEYRRQLKLVNDEKAKGSMDREAAARAAALSAQYQMMQNRVFNLGASLGETLKPALVDVMKSFGDVLAGVRDFAREHPQLTASLMKGAAVLAVVLTVLGAIAMGMAAVLGPIAMFRYGISLLGIQGGAAMAGLAGRIWGVISPIGKLIAAFSLGYTVGGYLNDGINKLLSSILGYETTLGGAIFDLQQKLTGGFGQVLDWFTTLPARMTQAGIDMIGGFIQGIQQRWGDLKAAVTGVADSSVGWIKERLGIHSPSRVFAELGGFTMQGFEQGITGGQDGPLNAVSGMARQLAALGAGITLGGAAMAGGMPLDTRPPLTAGGGQGGGGGIVIQQLVIHGAPGQGVDNIQRQVEQALENIMARQAVRRRASLRDRD